MQPKNQNLGEKFPNNNLGRYLRKWMSISQRQEHHNHVSRDDPAICIASLLWQVDVTSMCSVQFEGFRCVDDT